jgi:hypothetical protein
MTWNIIYALGFVNLVILGWLVFLTSKYKTIRKKAEVIFEDADPQKLASMLKEYFRNIEEVNENHQKLQRVLASTKKTAELGLNKVGFLRYNPFGDIGSDQSFSMCLLNTDLDGFVLSSIHSREGTRVYSKPVHKGSSPYNLSAEEDKVIKLAIGSPKVKPSNK